MRRMSGERSLKVWRVLRKIREAELDVWVDSFMAEGVYDQAFWQRAMRNAMKTEARHFFSSFIDDETGLRAVVNVQRVRGKRKVRIYKLREEMTAGDHRQVAAGYGRGSRAYVRLRNQERHQLHSRYGVQLSLFELIEIGPSGRQRRLRG